MKTLLVVIAFAFATATTVHADRLAVSISQAPTASSSTMVAKKPTAPCNRRCIDRKIMQIQDVMSKAIDAPSGGLTRFTCVQANRRIAEIADTLPDNVELVFEDGWDDAQCSFQVPPRKAVIQR